MLKKNRIITFSQYPWIQGVPSLKISVGSIGRHVEFWVGRQHLLQASSSVKKYIHCIKKIHRIKIRLNYLFHHKIFFTYKRELMMSDKIMPLIWQINSYYQYKMLETVIIFFQK